MGGTLSAVTVAIVARDIVHSYGRRRALDGFSIEVPAGCVFGLLGPNGSGKSTFITMLAAMEVPQAGSLQVFGVSPATALKARIGTVFQENAQDPLMPVFEYLGLAGRLFGVNGRAARSEAVLQKVGLGGRQGEAIGALSGGMRRRLEVARALLHDPELLILDEPTTGVDPGERRSLWDAVRTDGRSRTVLLATNDLAEAEQVCERVAFLKDGKVVATGTPAEIKRGLRRDSVAIRWDGANPADLGTIGSWPGTGEVMVEGGEVRVTVDDAATFVPRLFALAPGAIRAVRVEPTTLEDAYFRLVGTGAGGRR
jgi:ABC-2 type transport system ATP-binding protein